MVQPILLIRGNGRRTFAWNITANVGTLSVNKDEDVALVQLGYFFLAKNPKVTPAEREVYSQIVPGEGYGGEANETLSQAIRTHQKSRRGTQDGHVSVIKNDRGTYQDPGGVHSFQLVALVNNIIDGSADDFPRIDLLGETCPAVLRAAIIRECAPPPK